jgi:hypothetical protein
VIDLASAIAAVAISLPASAVPLDSPRYEAPEDRAVRMVVIAEAIASAATRATCTELWATLDAPCRRIWPGSATELAALLLSLGYLESGFAEWVHAGRCRLSIGECDSRKVGGVWVVGAKSPWQIQWTSYSRDAWHELEGTGEWSTFVAAWTAARVVSGARRMCAYRRPRIAWLPATVSAYATGGHCDYPRAGKRAAFVVRIEGRIRSELARGTTASAFRQYGGFANHSRLGDHLPYPRSLMSRTASCTSPLLNPSPSIVLIDASFLGANPVPSRVSSMWSSKRRDSARATTCNAHS